MMELHDAIEDAQYISAMHDDVPRPTKEWQWPSAEELQSYLDKLKAVNPRMFEAEGICKGNLGFYLFTKFCREEGQPWKVMAEFLEDVASFRSRMTTGLLIDFALKIRDKYLVPGSTGNDDPNRVRAPGLARYAMSKSVSDPNTFRDKLPRTPAAAAASAISTADRAASAAAAIVDVRAPSHIDTVSMEVAKNAIKVMGQPLDYAIAILNEASTVLGRKSGSIVSVVTAAAASNKSADRPPRVSMDVFDELEGIVFSYLVEFHFVQFKMSPYWTRHFQFLFMTERKVVEDDFALFRVLGRGGFGLVNACKRCTTGKLYAMKTLSKKRIKMKKAEALCMNERNILAIIQSPYVVCLKYAFTTVKEVLLVLDLMTGGDLGYLISRKGRLLEKEARYYAARTLLGIAALHEKNIAYRDLKPENILMDEAGYTKISDLGLACKVGKSGLTGTCGTRGYWAPEMLRRDANDKRERYTVTVDWFSFGCVVYEFLYGISPFRTERARKWGDFPKIEKADRDKAIDLAIQQMEPDFVDGVFDDQSKDLIRKLLNKDGRQRLGTNGYTEIAAHPWFRGIDWDNITRSRPPMKPPKDINMATQSEIGNFADEKESRKVILTEDDMKNYDQWEFISKRSFQEEVVEFLQLEEKLGPIPVERATSVCCSIS